jgi:hypothetical protein
VPARIGGEHYAQCDRFRNLPDGVGGAFQDLPAFNKVANQYIFQRSSGKDVRQLAITYTTADAPAAIPEPASLGTHQRRAAGWCLATAVLAKLFLPLPHGHGSVF